LETWDQQELLSDRIERAQYAAEQFVNLGNGHIWLTKRFDEFGDETCRCKSIWLDDRIEV